MSTRAQDVSSPVVLTYAPVRQVWRIHWGRMIAGIVSVSVAVLLLAAAMVSSWIALIGADSPESLVLVAILMLGFGCVYVPLGLFGVSACLDSIDRSAIVVDAESSHG